MGVLAKETQAIKWVLEPTWLLFLFASGGFFCTLILSKAIFHLFALAPLSTDSREASSETKKKEIWCEGDDNNSSINRSLIFGKCASANDYRRGETIAAFDYVDLMVSLNIPRRCQPMTQHRVRKLSVTHLVESLQNSLQLQSAAISTCKTFSTSGW